jgi:signal peptidase I
MAITKRRRPLIACLLGFLQLGIGLLYVGRPWLAIAVPFVPLALLLAARLTGVALLPWGMAAFCAVVICGWLGLVAWCGWAARKAGVAPLAWYQRWYIYLGYHVAVWLLVFCYVRAPLDWIGARPYRIPVRSMCDTLQPGDYVIADTWAFGGHHTPKRGEIVVFSLSVQPQARYAKRVIGLPGERIEGRDGQVYINGERLMEPYVNPSNNVKIRDSWNYVVPDDAYFILGDNRDDSYDSRYVGAIPRSRLYGRVRAIWVSFDPKTGLHFDRVQAVM